MTAAPDSIDLAVGEEPSRGHADAVGRAGEDEVARLERADARQVRHQLGHGEDEVGRAAVLLALAGHVAPQLDVVGVRERVDRHQRRADGAVRVEALAQRELRRLAGELHGAIADVLAEREAGDVRPGVGLRSMWRPPVPMTATSSTSQSTVAPLSTMSSCGPTRQLGNLVNVSGAGGSSIADSAACER